MQFNLIARTFTQLGHFKHGCFCNYCIFMQACPPPLQLHLSCELSQMRNKLLCKSIINLCIQNIRHACETAINKYLVGRIKYNSPLFLGPSRGTQLDYESLQHCMDSSTMPCAQYDTGLLNEPPRSGITTDNPIMQGGVS